MKFSLKEMLVNKIHLGSCAICILYVCLYTCVCICACLCVPVCACVFLLLENRPKPCTKSSQNVPKAATGDRTVLQPLLANDSWQSVTLFSNITHPPVLPRLQQVPKWNGADSSFAGVSSPQHEDGKKT